MSSESNGVLKLADARVRTPPVSAGIAAGLRAAAIEAIDETDVKDMMRAVMHKAKGGDVTAVKFIMDFLGQGAADAGPRIVQPKGDKADAELPRRILEYLAAKGPRKLPVLAQEMGIVRTKLQAVIDGNRLWFDVDSTGVAVSSDGWRIVKEDAQDDE